MLLNQIFFFFHWNFFKDIGRNAYTDNLCVGFPCLYSRVFFIYCVFVCNPIFLSTYTQIFFFLPVCLQTHAQTHKQINKSEDTNIHTKTTRKYTHYTRAIPWCIPECTDLRTRNTLTHYGALLAWVTPDL